MGGGSHIMEEFVADAEDLELEPVMGSQCRLHRMGMMRSQERDRVRRWAAENLLRRLLGHGNENSVV